MAYQKLQVSNSLDVIPSDSVDIPDPNTEVPIPQHELIHTGTGSGIAGAVFYLVDALSNFFFIGGTGTPLGIQVGDIVTNTVTGASATVTEMPATFFAAVLSANIMPISPAPAEAYKITRPDNKVRVDFGAAVQDVTSDLTLTQSPQNFVSTVAVGDIVKNISTGLLARVDVINSDTLLTLSASIMPAPTDPAQNYDILQAAPIANITAGDFSVAETLTLVPGALASTVGIRPGAIVYNSTAAKAYYVVNVVDNDTLNISPSAVGGATDTFVIYNEATIGAVLYNGGPALSSNQDLKLTLASNTTNIFKNMPKGAYIPVQVVRVWVNGSAPEDIVALW